MTDPLELPAGDYDIEVYAADADPTTDDAAISGSATLPAGANASIIAHLGADGTPQLSVFVNDTSEIASGEARLVVRHTAAAPAVDVLANGDALFTNLANPNQATADVPAAAYSAAVAATGTIVPVIGPVDLTLEAGTAYFVYAVGSLEDENLNVLTQTIAGLGAAPAPDVPNAGFGPDGESFNWMWLALAVGSLGAMLLGGSAVLGAKIRNR